MKIESPAFTINDFRGVAEELAGREQRWLAERLERASNEMLELASHIPDEAATDEGEWNAKEILAHIAVASQGWGAIGYMLARGRTTDLAAQDVIRQRDPIAMASMSQPVADLARQAATAHQRTIRYLRSAPANEYLNRFTWEFGEGSADFIFRIMLTAHLEQHVAQLVEVLSANRAGEDPSKQPAKAGA
jgi:hypothetical protein